MCTINGMTFRAPPCMFSIEVPCYYEEAVVEIYTARLKDSYGTAAY